jgi:predicted DNA binding CopG/RHH family protein
MTITNQHKKPIPDFKSRQEMAEWFDTHDMTEYDFKPVKVKFAKKLSHGLHIRLDDETLTKLQEKAEEKGIGITTLARMWLREKLHLQTKSPLQAT